MRHGLQKISKLCNCHDARFWGRLANAKFGNPDRVVKELTAETIFRRYSWALALFFALIFAPAEAFAVKLTEGITYSRGLKLDIHAPDKAGKRFLFVRTGKLVPVVLYVHGGGWVKGSRKKVYGLPEWLTSRGYMLVAIDYRKVPRTTIDGQVSDVARAIAWTARNIKRYGGDPDRIVIMGHSAGAHLVAMAAAQGKAGNIRGVIPNDVQAYDIVAYVTKRGTIGPMFGRAFSDNPNNWVRWSPITYARRASGLPPHLVMYSRSQGERRRSISIGYANVLKSRGVRVSVFHGTKYSHGAIASRLGRPGDSATAAVEKFLRRVMR